MRAPSIGQEGGCLKEEVQVVGVTPVPEYGWAVEATSSSSEPESGINNASLDSPHTDQVMASGRVLRLFSRPITNLSVHTSLGLFRKRAAVAAVSATQRPFSSDAPPPEHISRYPVPYKKDLPFDIVELMEEVETKGGFLPNVFKVLAHRPAEFRAFFTYYNELMNKETGHLTKADRELIVVATSIHNQCLYCVISHSALHRIYSKKPTLSDQVIVNYENADLSPRDRAMLDFAMAVCRSDTITDQHFLSLEEVGFDREDAWDIAAIAAFFAMSNRLAHLTDMRPNSEFYNMGRMPREKSRDKSQPEGSGETGQ